MWWKIIAVLFCEDKVEENVEKKKKREKQRYIVENSSENAHERLCPLYKYSTNASFSFNFLKDA